MCIFKYLIILLQYPLPILSHILCQTDDILSFKKIIEEKYIIAK